MRRQVYCHDEIDEIKKGLQNKECDSERIYESIKDFPIHPIREEKAVAKFQFESSCLNLGDHDDYRLLRNHQSQECILQEDEEDYTELNSSFQHLIHCFSCLFD